MDWAMAAGTPMDINDDNGEWMDGRLHGTLPPTSGIHGR